MKEIKLTKAIRKTSTLQLFAGHLCPDNSKLTLYLIVAEVFNFPVVGDEIDTSFKRCWYVHNCSITIQTIPQWSINGGLKGVKVHQRQDDSFHHQEFAHRLDCLVERLQWNLLIQ